MPDWESLSLLNDRSLDTTNIGPGMFDAPGQFIRIPRVSRGHCHICKRDHDNDGMFAVVSSRNSVLLVGCHRGKSEGLKMRKIW